MISTGERLRTRREPCPSATFSTTNPTWTDPGANPGLRGEWPETNRLKHGTALTFMRKEQMGRLTRSEQGKGKQSNERRISRRTRKNEKI
jgi:hypothetical protein